MGAVCITPDYVTEEAVLESSSKRPHSEKSEAHWQTREREESGLCEVRLIVSKIDTETCLDIQIPQVNQLVIYNLIRLQKSRTKPPVVSESSTIVKEVNRGSSRAINCGVEGVYKPVKFGRQVHETKCYFTTAKTCRIYRDVGIRKDVGILGQS